MRRIPVVALTVLVVAVLADTVPLAAPLRLFLHAPLYFWLPGRLLLNGRRALTGLGPGPRLGADLCAGTALTTLLLELLRALGLGPDSLPSVLALVLAVWTTAAWLGGSHAAAGPRRSRTDADLVPLALAVLVGLGALARGSAIGPSTDAGMQLAVLQRVAETGTTLARAPFVDLDISWYYADAWHRLLATTMVQASPAPGEVVALWHGAGALVGVITVLGFALLAVECLSGHAAAIAMLLFAIHLRLDQLAFPSSLGKGLLWGALGLAMVGLRTRSRGVGVVVLIAACALAFLHPVESYLLGAALVARAVFEWRQERRSRAALPGLALGALVLACALPVFVTAGHSTWREQSVRADPIDPSIEVRELAAGVFIVDPRFWGVDMRAPLNWLALLGLGLVIWRGSGRARAFLLGATLVAALGLLFPPLVLLVVKLHLPTFLLARTGILFPAALLAAAGIASLPWFQSYVGLALVVLLTASSPLPRELAEPSPRALTARHPLLSDEGRALLASIPRHSVVLTDPWSADFLPGAYGHHPVAGLTWHTATRTDQVEVRDFLTSGAQRSRDAMLLLQRRQVDYVLLVDWKLSGLDWPGYGSDWQPRQAGLMMRANVHVFREAGTAPRLELWRVRTHDPRASLTLKDDPGEPPLRATAVPAIARIADFDVIGFSATGVDVVVILRARANTRESPLVSVVATPSGFTEQSWWHRLRRVALGRPSLGHAAGRSRQTFRIDNRFYLDRELEAGELLEVPLRLAIPVGATIRVGAAASLPAFPLPLGPALDRHFGVVPLVEGDEP